MELTAEDKHFLIKVAKDMIFFQLTDDEFPAYYKSKELYKERHGIFIKIMLNNKLRAYGGILEPEKDLIDTVQEVTLQACFKDTRFLPLKPDEIDHISIHMAFVESFEDVRDRKLIKPDIHGVYVEAGSRRGVLLPWDIAEFKLDTVQYIKEAAIKAGIESVGNAKLKIIRLITFSDKD